VIEVRRSYQKRRPSWNDFRLNTKRHSKWSAVAIVLSALARAAEDSSKKDSHGEMNKHGTFRKTPPEARGAIDGLQWPCAVSIKDCALADQEIADACILDRTGKLKMEIP